MTIISIEAKIEELEKQLEESKKQLLILKSNFIDGSPVGRWIPSKGERYYAICADGEITSYTFDGDLDLKMYNIGNCFKTLDEAEFMEERLKTIAELHQWSESRDRYWGPECQHYYFVYDYTKEILEVFLNNKKLHFFNGFCLFF